MLLVEGVVAVALGVALSDDYPVGVPVLTEDVASTVAQGLELVLDAEARHLRYLCLASLGGGRVRGSWMNGRKAGRRRRVRRGLEIDLEGLGYTFPFLNDMEEVSNTLSTSDQLNAFSG